MGAHCYVSLCPDSSARPSPTGTYGCASQFPKSAVRVQTPPFTLQRTMASLFPSDFTVFWRRPDWPPLTITFRVQHALPRFARRLLVIGCKAAPPQPRKAPPVTFRWYATHSQTRRRYY